MMKCEEAKVLLHGLLDRELDFVRESGVQAHLDQCPDCAAEYRRQEVLRTTIQRNAANYHAPADLLDTLRRRHAGEPSRRARWSGWRSWQLALPALAVMMLATWLLMPIAPPAHKPERFVYHINNLDNAATALQNISFHLKATPDAKFVVVTHNSGVDFLLKDAKDAQGNLFAPRVAGLAAQGVTFRVCNNTLTVRQIPAELVLAQASLVPSGIAEVGRLQVEEGYAYLKP